ncbi:MAG: hypothetical protein K9K67_14255 [Bacteriovoracaceae bacterium]|nr:hypothetical protein [Bacteriovoracaceae bacterium]
MFASSQSDKRLVFFRFILLSLSMTFLGYSTYKSDENLVYFKADLVTEKSNITSEIKHYERQLKRIEKDLNTLDGSMKVYLKHDLVTKGLKTIAPERERLAQERGRVKASLAGLKNGLGKLNSRLVSVNLIDTLEILTIKTYVTLVTFFVFQTLICIILPDILSKVFIKEGE